MLVARKLLRLFNKLIDTSVLLTGGVFSIPALKYCFDTGNFCYCSVVATGHLVWLNS